MKCHKIVVTGMVQGVGFRYHTCHEGLKLGLSGYAMNLNDGSVEVIAQGNDEAVDALTNWLKEGPRTASVTSMNYEVVDQGTWRGFEIL